MSHFFIYNINISIFYTIKLNIPNTIPITYRAQIIKVGNTNI